MRTWPATRLRVCAVSATLLGTLVLAGCGGIGDAESDGRPSVVASFYPLQYVAERVAGDHAQVENLTSAGAEPHDLELTVRQTAQVADADIALYQQGFQPAVDDAVAQNGPEHVLDVTETIDLEKAGHEGESEHAEHEHDGADPHFWLDPAQLSAVAEAFTAELVDVDPDNVTTYEANLAALQADLSALDEEFTTGLARCELDTVVVSHDAFGYLEKYGLHFEAIAGLSPDAEPSPAHIRELHELIDTHQVTTVFSETLASPAMSEAIAGDLGLDTAVLDPIEGLGESTADEDYLSLMRKNLAALQEANRCS